MNKENTISSFISKLADFECFQSKYIYKSGKKCRHTLKNNSEEEFLFPIVFSINRLDDKSSDFEELINEKLISSFQKCICQNVMSITGTNLNIHVNFYSLF